jgi:hypothetical protein
MGTSLGPKLFLGTRGVPTQAASVERPPTIEGVDGENTALLRVNIWGLAPGIHVYIEGV